MLLCRTFGILVVVFAVIVGVPGAALAAQASPTLQPSSHTLVLDGLGKGAAPLDGPWQFHLGDDPVWADPTYDDSHWEQIAADKPWGMQGHANYTGYAWYRRSLSVTPAPGSSPDMALLVPGMIDVYQIYWNGVEVGHRGQMPPSLRIIIGGPAPIYRLGPVHSGVLAFRVWSMPQPSNASAAAGGFIAMPQIGGVQAIDGLNNGLNYRWLRRQQFTFALTSLYTLVALLSLVAWLRDRKQWLFFWMTMFAFTPLAELFLRSLHIPYSAGPLNFAVQTEIQIREISQWFLVLWLLQLHDRVKLVRFTRIAASIALCGGFCDGMLFLFYPAVLSDRGFQITDAVLTLPLLVAEVVPLILVAFAVLHRQRLDPSRWFVAAFAFLSAMIYAVTNIAVQGNRFTHWTLSETLSAPLFSLGGSPIGLLTVVRTLLFLSIVYAVIHYSIAERQHQAGMEQEIQNARELQQVLVPETVPSLTGFTLTSAYRPAQEVGGDFFQIIPLGGGSTLVVLGDVSGKGLRAAMAVSLIVGAISASAETTTSPAEILAALNRRLHGRLNGGFATCLALRLDSQGDCTIACAGHPAPFLNGSELPLPGALPLGVTPGESYKELALSLQAGDHLSLYTDGLLEARSASGEIYGFDRLRNLFSTRPDAAQATEAAVAFGQDDDITVLTLTRLKAGEESSTLFVAPVFDSV